MPSTNNRLRVYCSFGVIWLWCWWWFGDDLAMLWLCFGYIIGHANATRKKSSPTGHISGDLKGDDLAILAIAWYGQNNHLSITWGDPRWCFGDCRLSGYNSQHHLGWCLAMIGFDPLPNVCNFNSLAGYISWLLQFTQTWDLAVNFCFYFWEIPHFSESWWWNIISLHRGFQPWVFHLITSGIQLLLFHWFWHRGMGTPTMSRQTPD